MKWMSWPSWETGSPPVRGPHSPSRFSYYKNTSLVITQRRHCTISTASLSVSFTSSFVIHLALTTEYWIAPTMALSSGIAIGAKQSISPFFTVSQPSLSYRKQVGSSPCGIQDFVFVAFAIWVLNSFACLFKDSCFSYLCLHLCYLRFLVSQTWSSPLSLYVLTVVGSFVRCRGDVFQNFCLRASAEKNSSDGEEATKMVMRKQKGGWKIDFSEEKPPTPLLDTINYPIHMKSLSKEVKACASD